MASPAAARGPLTFLLQSASGQYIVLGMGVYTMFPEQVRNALKPLLMSHPALMAQFGEAFQDSKSGSSHNNSPIIIQTPAPMVIHGNSAGGKSWTAILVYSVAGAGACWVGYILCSQLLPDAISEFMPVTKRLYQKTSQTLGKGILQVKNILEERIAQLMGQQHLLEKKQDETHKDVQDVKSNLGQARHDLANLQSSLDRCEAGLEHSHNMQGYTLRGIRLLVRCVTSFLPDESNFIDDITHYIEEGNSGASPATNSLDRRSSLPPPPAPPAIPQPQQQHYRPIPRASSAGPSMVWTSQPTRTSSAPPVSIANNASAMYYSQANHHHIESPYYSQPQSQSQPHLLQQQHQHQQHPPQHSKHQLLNKAFGASSPPSIASIDSDDISSSNASSPVHHNTANADSSSHRNNNNNTPISMGDIQALLGH